MGETLRFIFIAFLKVSSLAFCGTNHGLLCKTTKPLFYIQYSYEILQTVLRTAKSYS